MVFVAAQNEFNISLGAQINRREINRENIELAVIRTDFHNSAAAAQKSVVVGVALENAVLVAPSEVSDTVDVRAKPVFAREDNLFLGSVFRADIHIFRVVLPDIEHFFG